MLAFSLTLMRDLHDAIPPAIWMWKKEYDYWADIVYRMFPDGYRGVDPLQIYTKLMEAGYIDGRMGVAGVRKVLRRLVRQKRVKKVIDLMHGGKTVFLRLNVL